MRDKERPVDPNKDLVASERAGIIVWHLARGEVMTTRQVMEKVGISYGGAWVMMPKLCRVLPIGYDKSLYEGCWISMERGGESRLNGESTCIGLILTIYRSRYEL